MLGKMLLLGLFLYLGSGTMAIAAICSYARDLREEKVLPVGFEFHSGKEHVSKVIQFSWAAAMQFDRGGYVLCAYEATGDKQVKISFPSGNIEQFLFGKYQWKLQEETAQPRVWDCKPQTNLYNPEDCPFP